MNSPSLDYMVARYYSSSLGRFMAADPAQRIEKNLPQPQRWNRYTYSGNNPLVNVDPDGKDFVKSVDKQNKTVNVTVNVVIAGPAASPQVAQTFQDQANASWGGPKSFTAKDGSQWQLNVKVNATTDASKFSDADGPNTVEAKESGETGVKGNEGTLNVSDLSKPGVAGHETAHMMGVLDSPDPQSPGLMNQSGENAKPTQEEINQAGQIALEKPTKKPKK